jgi:hypothetical protein
MRVCRAQDRHLVGAAQHGRRARPEVLTFEHEQLLRTIERRAQHQDLPVLLLVSFIRIDRSDVDSRSREQDDQGGNNPS